MLTKTEVEKHQYQTKKEGDIPHISNAGLASNNLIILQLLFIIKYLTGFGNYL